MSKFLAQFQQIETWNSKKIKAVLTAAESEPELKAAIQERYQPLVNFIEGKDLSALPTVPNKLTTSKVQQKQWTPDAVSISIMGNIYIEEISLKKIKVFPEWITHLKSLKSLRFIECKTLVFPETMHRMTGLTQFVCYDCQLKQIPEPLRALKDLRDLSLSKNQLTVIPDWIAELPLMTLDLAFNKISQVTTAIGGLNKLNTLELSYNHLRNLPTEIGGLKVLADLQLGGNKMLSTLPDELSNLKNLGRLDLSSNNFSVVPEQIKGLKNLRDLDISLNPISEIPDWIGELKELNALDIDNTNVDMLPSSILQLKKLYALDIKNTPLQLKDSFSHSLDKELVKSYLTRLFSKKEDTIVPIYSDLESRDTAKMKAALEALQANPVFWQRAEKRYLYFIQVRLNDPKATLWQFADAMLSEAEEKILLESGVQKKTFLSFHYSDPKESKLLIDFAGVLVKNVLDINLFCKEAATKSSEAELVAFSQNKLAEIKRAIMDEAAVYSKGWFGGLTAAFAGVDIHKVMYDHTTLDEANHSIVLREFMFFIGAFSTMHVVTFDIFQSEAPNLTEVFWLLPFIPKTLWGDTDPEFPASPLGFKRAVQIKKGDFAKWEEFLG